MGQLKFPGLRRSSFVHLFWSGETTLCSDGFARFSAQAEQFSSFDTTALMKPKVAKTRVILESDGLHRLKQVFSLCSQAFQVSSFDSCGQDLRTGSKQRTAECMECSADRQHSGSARTCLQIGRTRSSFSFMQGHVHRLSGSCRRFIGRVASKSVIVLGASLLEACKRGFLLWC